MSPENAHKLMGFYMEVLRLAVILVFCLFNYLYIRTCTSGYSYPLVHVRDNWGRFQPAAS